MIEVTFDLIRQARQRVTEMDPGKQNRWSMTERDKEVLLMILDDAAAIYEARIKEVRPKRTISQMHPAEVRKMKEEADANNEHFRKNHK